MNRLGYQCYADAFNQRDYDAVYDHYVDGADIVFFGVSLASREQFKAFYSFLHDHVNESLTVLKFACSDDLVALEGIIRIEATKTLTAEALEERGYPKLFAMENGQIHEMPQYIHYHLNGDGKFTSVGCVLA